ncbi:tetratricopeptide repeat protein [Tenacibaculum aestuariivivum]|uniref:tetratricopeptide repeat-containing sensor histidine kinase n=1 Tax=Tenacibaculum aestuariivivum TaxID=2006131 RepID=UPI003AB5BCA0
MNTFRITLLFLITTSLCLSQSNDDSLMISALEKREVDYVKLKEYFNRVRFTDKEINLFLEKNKKSSYRLDELYVKNTQIYLYNTTTEYTKIINKYKKSLFKARKINNIESEIAILNELGLVYRQQDKIRLALNYHQEALEIIAKINNPNVAIKISSGITNNSIGTIYLMLNQYERALRFFNTSIIIQQKINDVKGLAINYHGIGLTNENIGNLDLALQNYYQSLEYYINDKDCLGKIICHNSISGALIKQGKYDNAFEYIIEVIALTEKINDPYYLSVVYNTLGWVFLKKNSYIDAKDYLNRSLKIGLENNILSSLIVSYNLLSELYEKEGVYKEALYYYQSSIEIEKKMLINENIHYVNSLINKYDTEISTHEIESLAKEAEIAKLKLLRNRNVLMITLVLIALFGVLLYLTYRHRLLKNDKEILLLEQDALRIQMNPHFVFNALNSIKLYIINNEQKNAVHYLNKFSKLIRNILESSSVKEVTLSEELKTMSLYMSIENIRFSNEIVYQESLIANLNIETIKIPPLILQPFLENAIWHGLSSKKGVKKVKLSVSKISNEFIQIDIEDNGIGRKEALRIKSNKTLNRKSIGIDLTKERLKNFSIQFKNNYLLSYIDLFDEVGNAKGTRVSLKIPLI